MIALLKCYETPSLNARATSSPRSQKRGSVRFRLYRFILSGVALVCATGCEEQILHDLSEREANRVVSELHAAKVSASKLSQSDGRWTIGVAKREVVTALRALEFQRVLPSPGARGAPVSKGGFIPSREERLFRYERAMSEALEDSLTAIPGVLEARVHLNLPAEDPLLGPSRVPAGSGSVLLLVDERWAARDEDIAHLVGGAAGVPSGAVKVLRSSAERPVEAQHTVSPESRAQEVNGKNSIDTQPVAVALLGALGVSAAWIGRVCVRRRRKRVKFSLPSEKTTGGVCHAE